MFDSLKIYSSFIRLNGQILNSKSKLVVHTLYIAQKNKKKKKRFALSGFMVFQLSINKNLPIFSKSIHYIEHFLHGMG